MPSRSAAVVVSLCATRETNGTTVRTMVMRFPLGLVVPIAAAALMLVCMREASACGLTPPIGPSGLATVCHGDSTPRVHAGLSAGGTSTSIRFPNGRG